MFKKYPSLKIELAELEKLLLQNPQLGTALGNHLYKIRISIKSKGKGKSGREFAFKNLVKLIVAKYLSVLPIWSFKSRIP